MHQPAGVHVLEGAEELEGDVDLVRVGGEQPAPLRFAFADVPGLLGPAADGSAAADDDAWSCAVYSVWERLALGRFTGSFETPQPVEPRGSALSVLAFCFRSTRSASPSWASACLLRVCVCALCVRRVQP